MYLSSAILEIVYLRLRSIGDPESESLFILSVLKQRSEYVHVFGRRDLDIAAVTLDHVHVYAERLADGTSIHHIQ